MHVVHLIVCSPLVWKRTPVKACIMLVMLPAYMKIYVHILQYAKIEEEVAAGEAAEAAAAAKKADKARGSRAGVLTCLLALDIL